MNKLKIMLYIVSVILCFSCAYGKYTPVTYTIPTDTIRIQEAIDRAKSGDTIIILPGVYSLESKNITIPDKSIIIKGAAGAEKTIIKGSAHYPTITFEKNSRATLQGLTITSEVENQNSEQEPTLYGGGILCKMESAPTIEECIISGNKAIFGGGLYCSSSSHPAIVDCIISNNSALECGGGICVFEASARITRSKIVKNKTGTSGGGIFCYKDSAVIQNTIIAHNSSSFIAGGASCIESFTKLINTTIAFNKSELSGGVFGLDGDIRLNNLIMWGNGDDLLLQDFTLESRPRYSNIENSSFTGINGNISTNPLFIDPNRGDFHLDSHSPCINAGEDIKEYLDQDGSRNDMGAFGGPEASMKSKERNFK